MTLIWPRLTWPALACRHAAPWPRKTSATSSAGRDKSGRRALRERLPRGRDELFQGTGDLAECLQGDAGIERGGVELLVPEQNLDHPNIGLLFEQVGGEAMPQG